MENQNPDRTTKTPASPEGNNSATGSAKNNRDSSSGRRRSRSRKKPAARHQGRSGGEVTPRTSHGNRNSRTGAKTTDGASVTEEPRTRRRAPRPTAAREEFLEGQLSVHQKGFGFVLVPGGSDVFIPVEAIGEARDGDIVKAAILSRPQGRNPRGRVAEIVTPSKLDFVGLLKASGPGKLELVSDNGPAQGIPVRDVGRARAGQVVVMDRQGKVQDILGRPGEAGLDVRMIARSRGLPGDFPADVLDESRKLKNPDFRRLKKSRMDLRKELIFTIDPVSAEDFDDAISVKQLADGRFELGVHIADVSHFVQASSALDAEARQRGTSIYFVNSVIPMLPEKLANDLCSLKPDVDRPAYSVIMILDSRGQIQDYRIGESIIRSKRRYSYEEVEQVLNGERDSYARELKLLHMLTILLRRIREEAGSIDFDAPVPVITLDERGLPREIRPSQRLDAHRLVEECMLAANLTVARHVQKLGAPPFIYRIHSQPEIRDSQALLDLLKRYGIDYRVSASDLDSDDYRKLLGIIENMEYRDLVESVALRSMTKAVYDTENQGHFGLAFDAYTHFTSPIRRYPDLMIHRLLKGYAAQGMPMEGSFREEVKAPRPFQGDRRILGELSTLCRQCTEREIRASEAEREYIKLKSMEFLNTRIGHRAQGVVSGVTSFGVFVQLKDYLIDGLIHISNLKDDDYFFDEDRYQIQGRRSGKVFRLGDPLEVVISSVSLEERKADFLPAPEEAVPRKPRSSTGQTSRRKS